MAFIKKNTAGRKALFTDRSYDKEDLVMKLNGHKLTGAEIAKMPKEIQAEYLQIGTSLYLDMEKENESFINHSCVPNCYIKAIVNSAFLVALIPIAKGDELTFDYSLTSTDKPEEWQIQCNCHRFYCRGKISGFDSIPAEKKKEAIDEKIAPRYILNRNET